VLSRTHNLSVQFCTAQHPNTPVEVLTELLRDSSNVVAASAAANPNLPAHILAMWQLTRTGPT